MNQFTYRARTNEGRVTTGVLRAASREQVVAQLTGAGLVPIEITATEANSIWHKVVFGGLIGDKELILFSRQLASMIQAGVPILQALQTLSNQISRPSFQQLLVDMVYDVEAGEALSSSMRKHTEIFSPFYLGVIRTGESSGQLTKSLNTIADYLERNYLFRRKLQAALLYPVFILAVVIILTIIMFTFVLPQLTLLFAGAGVQLPWPTRLLIGLTNFMSSYWYIILLALGLLGVVIRSYLKTPDGRYAASNYALRLPLISRVWQKIYLARLTAILHMLFDSHVPALESLQLAQEALGNRVYRRILDETVAAVKDGMPISKVWAQEPHIPPMLTTMVGVGERSGKVAVAFAEANRYFTRDVEDVLASLTILIEPILVIILGLGVAIVVAAVLLPIYNLVLVL